VASVRAAGWIGAVGVFVPQDPGAPDELRQQGGIAFDWDLIWFKGQSVGTRPGPVKAYNRYLRDMIHHVKA
jgi:glutathione-independent formaldehyde dehydrogenase